MWRNVTADFATLCACADLYACAVVEQKMAAVSGSSAKLYRFPPTRELQTDYDAVVPSVRGRGRHVRELEDYLRRREHEVAVDGKDYLAIRHCLRDNAVCHSYGGRERISSYCTPC